MSVSGFSEQMAWEAYERKDYTSAEKIWKRLIRSAESETGRRELLNQYCYTLVAMKRFGEARMILKRLHEETGSHIYLHQMGMVEREAGNYRKALALFEQEMSLLPEEDDLARAANLYEQGLLNGLLGKREIAVRTAERCLALSLAVKDDMMLGCAYRLLGDINSGLSPEAAEKYYLTARKHFLRAGDRIASDEIDERLAGSRNPCFP